LRSLFKDVGGAAFSAEVNNFIQLLIDNHRIALLPEIVELYEGYCSEALKTMRVELIAAFDVTELQQQQFAATLKQRFSREITLQCSVDKTLLGGAIIRAGDKVIDGSALGRLNQLADSLI